MHNPAEDFPAGLVDDGQVAVDAALAIIAVFVHLNTS
jgi:hypothetical protein